MKKPINENYAAVVVKITTLIPLAGCNNVQGAIIMGNQVIVGNDVKIGDIGLYFPLECALSEIYMKSNNLYRDPLLNLDPLKKGYFEKHGRIKCMKFMKHKSEGLFMPLESLDNIENLITDSGSIGITFKINDTFDELDGIVICSKYIPKGSKTPGSGNQSKSKQPKETKIIENQFRFHQDTMMLYKNLDKISPQDLISITYKMHGTSGISSYVLCKNLITIGNKISAWISNHFINPIINILSNNDLTTGIISEDYDYIYSSRKCIKNADINPNAEHFYGVDIWGLAHEVVKPFLQKGMTFYYEIVGYLPSGAGIQGKFDYGQEPGTFGVYIYRITSTNVDGKVIEFSAHQVQDFCKANFLNAVPELYYGYAKNIIDSVIVTEENSANIKHVYSEVDSKSFGDALLITLKSKYNEKNCYMCKNTVPEEGCVIRLEKNDFEAYKCKSNAFYELETKELDKGVINIEDEN